MDGLNSLNVMKFSQRAMVLFWTRGLDSTAANSFTRQEISRKTADAAGNRAESLG